MDVCRFIIRLFMSIGYIVVLLLSKRSVYMNSILSILKSHFTAWIRKCLCIHCTYTDIQYNMRESLQSYIALDFLSTSIFYFFFYLFRSFTSPLWRYFIVNCYAIYLFYIYMRIWHMVWVACIYCLPHNLHFNKSISLCILMVGWYGICIVSWHFSKKKKMKIVQTDATIYL